MPGKPPIIQDSTRTNSPVAVDALSKQPAKDNVTRSAIKPNPNKTSGGSLFIVHNSDRDWKVHQYLHDWCNLSKPMDIATGFFEIDSLLALAGKWQKVDQIRLLIGDEVSPGTRRAFEQGINSATDRFDNSMPSDKAHDELKGADRPSASKVMQPYA